MAVTVDLQTAYPGAEPGAGTIVQPNTDAGSQSVATTATAVPDASSMIGPGQQTSSADLSTYLPWIIGGVLLLILFQGKK